jgi:hypothetical protein
MSMMSLSDIESSKVFPAGAGMNRHRRRRLSASSGVPRRRGEYISSVLSESCNRSPPFTFYQYLARFFLPGRRRMTYNQKSKKRREQ